MTKIGRKMTKICQKNDQNWPKNDLNWPIFFEKSKISYRFGAVKRNDMEFYIISFIVSFRFKHDQNRALDRNFAHVWFNLIGHCFQSTETNSKTCDQ